MEMNQSVILHSKPKCPYCEKAKHFLKSKSLSFSEIIYDPLHENYDDKKNTLISQTNHRSFPQIFIGKTFIGGYDDMILLYATQRFHDIYESEIGIALNKDDDF
jgi:glutaredoxin 3